MLLSAERSYSTRTYGSHAGSSASASAFSFEPTDTMQMKKPSRGYTVQSARPRGRPAAAAVLDARLGAVRLVDEHGERIP